MPYQLYWLAEPRILYGEASGDFTLAEIIEANETVMRLLNEASEPLYLIVDVGGVTNYPRIASQLREVVRYFYHPRFGCQLMYGVTSPAMRVILRILSGITPFDYQIVETLDSALSALHRREPGLSATIASVDRTLAGLQPVRPVRQAATPHAS